jgi:hypothetical protein
MSPDMPPQATSRPLLLKTAMPWPAGNCRMMVKKKITLNYFLKAANFVN